LSTENYNKKDTFFWNIFYPMLPVIA